MKTNLVCPMDRSNTKREVFGFIQRLATPVPSLCSSLSGWVLSIIYYTGNKTFIDLNTRLTKSNFVSEDMLKESLTSLINTNVLTHCDMTGEYSFTTKIRIGGGASRRRELFNSFCGLGLTNRSALTVYDCIRTDRALSTSTIRFMVKTTGVDLTARGVQRSLHVMLNRGLISKVSDSTRGLFIKNHTTASLDNAIAMAIS